jgi:hypothetical protein
MNHAETIVKVLLNEEFPPLGFKQRLPKKRQKRVRGTRPKAIHFSGVGYTGAGMREVGGGGSGPGSLYVS